MAVDTSSWFQSILNFVLGRDRQQEQPGVASVDNMSEAWRQKQRIINLEEVATTKKQQTKRTALSLSREDYNVFSFGQRRQNGLDDRERKETLYDIYENNPYVSGCIDLIAKRLVSGGIAYEKLQDVPTFTQDQNALQAFFAYINPYWDFAQFISAIATDYLIYGEAYAEILFKNGKPWQLWKIDCPTITYENDQYGMITGYVQTFKDRQKPIPFTPQQVIRWWNPHPKDSLKAFSPVEKVKDAALSYKHMITAQQNFFRRGAIHPYNIMLPGGEDSADRVISWFRENSTGLNNMYAPLILFEDAKIGQMGKGIYDLDFLNGLKRERDIILAAFGVPPALLSIIEGGNMGGPGGGEDQEKTLLYGAVQPLQHRIFNPINFQIVQDEQYGYGIKSVLVSSKMADMRNDQAITDVQDKRIRAGMLTINEVRAELGKPAAKGGDVNIFSTGREIMDIRSLGNLAEQGQIQLNQQRLQLVQQQQAVAAGAQGSVQPPQGPKSAAQPPQSESYTDGSLKAVALEETC